MILGSPSLAMSSMLMETMGNAEHHLGRVGAPKTFEIVGQFLLTYSKKSPWANQKFSLFEKNSKL